MSWQGDVAGTVSGERLYDLQGELLEAIASGKPLREVAALICLRVEALLPDAACALLAVDADARLHPLSAPALPPRFCDALDGLLVGPAGSPCGSVPLDDEALEMAHAVDDPLWADFRRAGLPADFLACWASPIKACDGQAVGKFVFFYRTRRGPSELERRIVATCVHPCAIAFAHHATQLRVHHLSCNDELTDLPNRASFRELAMQRVAALPPGSVATVVSLDLDDYKSVNETLGHKAGDYLLREIATRLQTCLRHGWLLGRLGGDCFMALAIAAAAESDMADVALRILATFDEPFHFDGQRIRIGACLGITQSTSPELPLEELSNQAQMALNEAKAQGRGNWCSYVPGMSAAVHLRRSLKRDVRNAIDNGDFKLLYQPIVLLKSRQPVAAEALLRWHHPQRGQVPPAVFIPVAEELGLIDVLGAWVLEEACAAAQAWPSNIALCVNLSPMQFRKCGFVKEIVDVLKVTGLPPQRLDLEVTESTLLAQDLPTRTALHDLHDLGLRLSLDDFGTGFSSLLSLRSFPFDRLKIDMSFVRGIGVDTDSTAIIRAVIGLARELGIRAVAEGVETEEQYAWLTQQTCCEGQGHLFGKAMSNADLHKLFNRSASAEASRAPHAGPAHPAA